MISSVSFSVWFMSLSLLFTACARVNRSPKRAHDLVVVFHRTEIVDGIKISYREAGSVDAPTILLLHGFPNSSHQFRQLFAALGGEFHLIAPDYPGFGYSDAPPRITAQGPLSYTFDRLSELTERFIEQRGLHRYFLYLFDFGAPIGFRVAMRHPEQVAGLLIQNGNAYEEGIAPQVLSEIRLPEADAIGARRKLLTLEMTRAQYLTGAHDPERVSPDGWTLDQHFLDQPGRADVMLSLLEDYRSNLAAYPTWQAWLRAHRPPMLIIWGRNDPIFLEAGAHAYLRDVPDAELHLIDGGHFALEEHAGPIATLIRDFVGRHVDSNQVR